MPPTKDIKILVVDDQENLGRMIQVVLEGKGYTVDTANYADDAINKIKSFQYQIVFCDLKMPDITGIELLKLVKQVSPFIQVIMMTGFSSLEVALKCLKNGATDFLFKPFDDNQQIFEAVEFCERKIQRWRKVIAKSGKSSSLDDYNLI